MECIIKRIKANMPNYQQGKIYTIRCRTDDTLIYVGSTTQSLAKRWDGHKVKSRKEGMLNRLIYKKVNNEWKNWYIELYELYPCSCKEELCRKEGEIIRLIGNLNVRIEGRTDKEYREENKDKKKEYDKIYSENNKDKISKQKKEYNDENKDKLKEYYEKNKYKMYENITCVCGCNLTKNNLNKHLKTQKHTDLMALQALPQQLQVQDE